MNKKIRKHLFEKKIEELYFEKLEDNCVEFLHYEDIGNNQTESFTKDEYIESIENMIDYIWGLETWVGKWTLELYKTVN